MLLRQIHALLSHFKLYFTEFWTATKSAFLYQQAQRNHETLSCTLRKYRCTSSIFSVSNCCIVLFPVSAMVCKLRRYDCERENIIMHAEALCMALTSLNTRIRLNLSIHPRQERIKSCVLCWTTESMSVKLVVQYTVYKSPSEQKGSVTNHLFKSSLQLLKTKNHSSRFRG